MTASPRTGERIPLPEGLTLLSDGSLRVDGVDGVAVVTPAAGAGSRSVSVEAGLRVLEALGGTHLPTVGPTTSEAPTVAVQQTGLWPEAAGEASDGTGDIVPAEPGDETTLLKPVSQVTDPPPEAGSTELTDPAGPSRSKTDAPGGVAGTGPLDTVWQSAGASTEEEPAAALTVRSAEESEGSEEPVTEPPELLETGIWEEPDEILHLPDDSRGSGDGSVDTGGADGVERTPEYPEPEPGSGRRRRGAHRAQTAPPVDAPGQPTADTPTAPDNSKSKQPQPVRAPQPLEALPNTEVVSASEAALIAAPPVRASICPRGHANPPEIRECLTCAQPLTGVFSYVRRPALATLTLSTGAAVEVAGDVVVGRAPQVQIGADPHIVALVAVPSPHHMVSRSHLLLTTSGWSVLAQDLGSSNGTVLARPGATPVLLGSGMPTPVFMGDLMDVGDGVTLRIDPPAWLRPQRA